MNLKNPELWQRIESFEFDDPSATLSFTQRLARENQWSLEFAQRVVDEYRRFLYLAMTAGHEVTPSEEVDQAWHLHLVYTHSYWDDLCGQVLGGPLHHGPTRGGRQQRDRYENLYDQTKVSYQQAFSAAPPADIWPPRLERFRQASATVRVDKGRYWVVPRIGSKFLIPATGSAAMMVPTVGILKPVMDLSGPQFLVLFAISYVVCCALTMTIFRMLQTSQSEDFQPEQVADQLNSSQVALLCDGPVRVVESSLAELRAHGAVEVQGDRFVRIGPSTVQPSTPMAARLLKRISDERDVASWSDLITTARIEITKTATELEQLGLLESVGRRMTIKVCALAPLVLLFAFGMFRCITGVLNGRPVGFLALGLVITAVTVWISSRLMHGRTVAGSQVRKWLHRRYALGRVTEQESTDAAPGDLALWTAVGGAAAIPMFTIGDEGFFSAMQQQRGAGNLADGSGGCGGSGLTGGCGASGGCSGGGGCGGGGCGGCGG